MEWNKNAFKHFLTASICPTHNSIYFVGIGIFAAFFLLLLIVSETIPPSAQSIPLVGLYHIGNMALVVLAMFISSLVAKLQDMDEKKKLPYSLQKVSFKSIT